VIVLDTTVLVYAVGSEHPLRNPSRRLLQAIADGALEASTSVEVIQEFVHLRARRRGRSDAAAAGRDYAELLSPLLSVTRQELQRGLELFESHERLGAFDAVLAAAAVSAGARALVSADSGFATLAREIPHVRPDHDGVASLVDAAA
jgi:predicted nucleic acid-binding protein